MGRRSIGDRLGKPLVPTAVLGLCVLSAVGCSAMGRTELQAAAPGTAGLLSADACAITLAPHEGQGAADLEIARLQQAARGAADPVAHLERLGWAWVARARSSYDPGFSDLALETARCIETGRPGSPEALLLRGHVLRTLHRFKEAETIGHELVARRGAWFDHGLLGDALVEQGKLDEAVASYQQMMDQRPGPEAYSRAAHVRWLKGDLAGAIEVMKMAARASDPRDPEPAAWYRTQLALYELQEGDVREAEAWVAAAFDALPDYAPALLAQGRLLLAQDRFGEAVAPLSRAARLNPLPEYQWLLIEALREVGQEAEAGAVESQLLERGAVEDPRTLALYLASTGREIDTAVRLAERELATRADVLTLDALSAALAAAGRLDDARAVSRRALAQGTVSAPLFFHAGLIASAAGDAGAARAWLGRASGMRRTLLPSERRRLEAGLAALRSKRL